MKPYLIKKQKEKNPHSLQTDELDSCPFLLIKLIKETSRQLGRGTVEIYLGKIMSNNENYDDENYEDEDYDVENYNDENYDNDKDEVIMISRML